MNRRGFLRAMFGTGAVAAIAPSQVWPFRKIFLPMSRPGLHGILYYQSLPDAGTYIGLSRATYPGPLSVPLTSPLSIAAVEAIELESFAHELPNLFFAPDPFYRWMKERGKVVEVLAEPLRVPQKVGEDALRDRLLRLFGVDQIPDIRVPVEEP